MCVGGACRWVSVCVRVRVGGWVGVDVGVDGQVGGLVHWPFASLRRFCPVDASA